MTKAQLITRLLQLAKELGGQKALARCLGVSPQYICDILHHRRDPGVKVLHELGIEVAQIYSVKVRQRG